jgi:AAA+ ATPase superfamily predicted ATPase
MMEFIDRERELAFLEEKWKDQRAQLIILWRKRRIGKTELVKQFITDKPHVYFLSESTSDFEQLKGFPFAMGQFFKESLLETRGFGQWEEGFRCIKEKDKRFKNMGR